MKNLVVHIAILTSALAVGALAQNLSQPCPALSPDQLALLLQMMGGAQQQSGPAVSPQALLPLIQAFQKMQTAGTAPSGTANNFLAPGAGGMQSAQTSATPSVPQPDVFLRQAGRDLNFTPAERKVAIVKSDANDIAEVFKNEAWLKGSQIVVRTMNEEITKMILSNREIGKWLWRADASGTLGKLGGKWLVRPPKARVYEVEFVPGVASRNIAAAGAPLEFVVQSAAMSGYEPVLLIAERRDRDGIRVLTSRKFELTPQMGASGPESVERKLAGSPQEKRVPLDLHAAPNGTVLVKPAQPLGPGEYALVFVKRDSNGLDTIPGAIDFRVE